MRKNSLNILLALATLAMLGIIVLQARWLEDSMRTRHQLRMERARTALQRVAEQVHYQDAANLLKFQLRGMADTLHQLQDDIRKTDYKLSEIAKVKDATDKPAAFTPRYHLRVEERYDTLIFMMDTVIMRRMLPRMHLDSAYHELHAAEDNETARYPARPLIRQYRTLLDSSRRVLDRVFVQMLAAEDRLEDHVDSLLLVHHLKNELRQSGVEFSSFGFQLSQEQPDGSSVAVYTMLEEETWWRDSLTVRLFPHNPFATYSTLTVYLPRDYLEVIQGMWGNLVMSLLLLFGVGGAFVYTVRSLVRQKKLGQMKNDFINNMTHELKTPIATIGLATEALQHLPESANTPQLQRYTKIIQQEGTRLHSQINRVLQAAEQQHSKPLQMIAQPLQPLVQQAADAFTLHMEKAGANFSVSIWNQSPLYILADSVHLPQAVSNLLDNALKYSPENPNIRLDLNVEGNHVTIQVTDNGIGMDGETQKRVFEPFFRAQTGNRHDTKGYGLGLSYVKGVIEGHQGTVQVSSKLGKGTTFKIMLPITIENYEKADTIS